MDFRKGRHLPAEQVSQGFADFEMVLVHPREQTHWSACQRIHHTILLVYAQACGVEYLHWGRLLPRGAELPLLVAPVAAVVMCKLHFLHISEDVAVKFGSPPRQSLVHCTYESVHVST